MERVRDALSPLKPLTAALPTPLMQLAISLLGPDCFQTLVLDLDPTSSTCLSLAISKVLGIAIITASSIVKIPQLLKLISSRSSAGISFTAYALETSAYLVGLAYNTRNGFPFSTYGETALIAVQNVVIAVLVLHYAGKGPLAGAFVAALAGAGYALFSETVISMEQLKYLQAAAGVVGVASKVPQIVTVWQEGGTGQLSAFAVFNYLVGSLTRIFTTIKEVDDKLILYGFIAGFILNAVLAAQMLYYWTSPVTATHGAEAKVMSEKAKAITSGATTRSKGPTTRRRG